MIFVSILVLLSLFLLLTLTGSNNGNLQILQEDSLSITIDNKESEPKSYSIRLENPNNLIEILKLLELRNDSFSFGFNYDASIGSYINSINGYEVNSVNNEYWKIIINEEISVENPALIELNNTDKLTIEIGNY